jgi:hypothetical protein
MNSELPRPKLHCPFPSAISPHRDEIEERNFVWLDRFGLLATPAAEKRARRARFGWLAARAYPNASHDGLLIAANWASWLFMLDDACDEAGIGSNSRAIRAHSDALLGVLAGLGPARSKDPLTESLLDLRERMLARGGAGWMSRFLNGVQDYFEACAWEAGNRERGQTPDLATYCQFSAAWGHSIFRMKGPGEQAE